MNRFISQKSLLTGTGLIFRLNIIILLNMLATEKE